MALYNVFFLTNGTNEVAHIDNRFRDLAEAMAYGAEMFGNRFICCLPA